MWQTSLRAEIDVTDNITLTSLSSYVDYEKRQGVDYEGLPFRLQDLALNTGAIENFSQELRLSNDGSNDIRWVVGVNYEHSTVDEIFDFDLTNSSANATFGTFLGYPISVSTSSNNQKMTNYAVFGNIEYDIRPALTIKAGVRYTKAKTSTESCNADFSGLPNETGPFFYDISLGGAFGAYPIGSCFVINDLVQTVGTTAPGAAGLYVDSLEEDNLSWRVGLDWEPKSGLLLYTNIAEGYKAGSFATIGASAFSQFIPVTQESVLAYEAGFKASLLDHRLQLNGAVFFYDYKDKQLRSKFNSPTFGVLDQLQNVPKSTIKGFELEFVAQPISSLRISADFTYLDATIDDFVGINPGGVQGDFSGTSIPYTPKYQAGVHADYDFPITDSIDGFVGGSVTYRSDTSSVIGDNVNPTTLTMSAIGGTPIFEIENYTLVDLRAGLKSSDGRWRFSIWGKNVFDKYYWQNSLAISDTISRYAGKPATYGASIRFEY